MAHAVEGEAGPARPAVWLFGEGMGVQVWAVAGSAQVRVAVLTGQGGPIVLLNCRLVGTPFEHDALAWALARISAGEDGFYVWRV